MDKKYAWLQHQDTVLWTNWPDKTLQTCAVGADKNLVNRSSPVVSHKKSRNAKKKRKRAENRIVKLANNALESGSVVNLSTKTIPPEVVVVLSKRVGFVPVIPHNKLQAKVDCYTTMAKLCNATRRKLRNSDEEAAEDDIPYEPLPPNLKLNPPTVPGDSGDPLIDGVRDEILAFVDLHQPTALRSNLSALERRGLKWILEEINHGDLRLVKADKGGALCIIEKSVMTNWESDKLSNCEKYECLEENDPTLSAHSTLLDFWRYGEEMGFVGRDICHDVVGLCEKKDGKPSRPSTSSIFKPGVPYYYGLLKIHKLQASDLRPGVTVPVRLVLIILVNQ
jgi:hypothetical protein